MKIRAHIIVSGRVQGVYFRGSTQNEAQRLGINGQVRNLPDGRVEAIFEGEKEAVDKIIDYVKNGPRFAKVSDLELEWQKFKGEFTDFRVLY